MATSSPSCTLAPFMHLPSPASQLTPHTPHPTHLSPSLLRSLLPDALLEPHAPCQALPLSVPSSSSSSSLSLTAATSSPQHKGLPWTFFTHIRLLSPVTPANFLITSHLPAVRPGSGVRPWSAIKCPLILTCARNMTVRRHKRTGLNSN